MKLKLKTLAGNHQFHYSTGKRKMFNVTAKFSMHAEIKHRIVAYDLLSLGLMCLKKFASFC